MSFSEIKVGAQFNCKREVFEFEKEIIELNDSSKDIEDFEL